MSEWWNQRSPFARYVVYATLAILAFAMAASVGAIAALVISDDQGNPSPHRQSEADRSGRERAERTQQETASANGEQTTALEKQASYVSKVGRIQANSVEAFSASHGRLLRYDSLTSDDVEEMQANQAALQEFAAQARDLGAPQKYEGQKKVFVSAIGELHQGARLAYVLAADPISATQADFDDYDSLANEADANLQRSNEMLGKDYKTIAGLGAINTP